MTAAIKRSRRIKRRTFVRACCPALSAAGLILFLALSSSRTVGSRGLVSMVIVPFRSELISVGLLLLSPPFQGRDKPIHGGNEARRNRSPHTTHALQKPTACQSLLSAYNEKRTLGICASLSFFGNKRLATMQEPCVVPSLERSV